jgi:hypothetical protein
MPASRTSRNKAPDLGHVPYVDLGPRRKLNEGDEAKVMLPERTTYRRMRFMWVDPNGHLTFVDHRGAHRTVTADRVGSISRKRKAHS